MGQEFPNLLPKASLCLLKALLMLGLRLVKARGTTYLESPEGPRGISTIRPKPSTHVSPFWNDIIPGRAPEAPRFNG